MNLNLLNVPALFKSELDLKMGAQKQYLEVGFLRRYNPFFAYAHC